MKVTTRAIDVASVSAAMIALGLILVVAGVLTSMAA